MRLQKVCLDNINRTRNRNGGSTNTFKNGLENLLQNSALYTGDDYFEEIRDKFMFDKFGERLSFELDFDKKSSWNDKDDFQSNIEPG